MIAADVKNLYGALRAAEDDWALRLVLADALEEAGEEVRAFGQRWQAENTTRTSSYVDTWGWLSEEWRQRAIHNMLKTAWCHYPALPDYLFEALELNFTPYYAVCWGSDYKGYPTVERAESELAIALWRLRKQ